MWQFFFEYFFLQNYETTISSPGDLASKLVIQMKPMDPVLEAGAQKLQVLNGECVEDYIGKYHPKTCSHSLWWQFINDFSIVFRCTQYEHIFYLQQCSSKDHHQASFNHQ